MTLKGNVIERGKKVWPDLSKIIKTLEKIKGRRGTVKEEEDS